MAEMNGSRKDPHRYDDLLYMEHPVSKTHPPMDPAGRAAQFAPFAALTGLDEELEETARQQNRERDIEWVQDWSDC